jgi:hypothetical protein
LSWASCTLRTEQLCLFWFAAGARRRGAPLAQPLLHTGCAIGKLRYDHLVGDHEHAERIITVMVTQIAGDHLAIGHLDARL